jgi:hypothetical protein
MNAAPTNYFPTRQRMNLVALPLDYTVNLVYIRPDGTSVFCPLYAKSVICVNRTLSSLRVNRTNTMSVLHDEMPHTNWRGPSRPEHPPAVIHSWHSG